MLMSDRVSRLFPQVKDPLLTCSQTDTQKVDAFPNSKVPLTKVLQKVASNVIFSKVVAVTENHKNFTFKVILGPFNTYFWESLLP